MYNRLTNISFLLLASHILCCGIPLVLGVLNISGLVGLNALHHLHNSWYEAVELPLLCVSFALLLLGFYLHHTSSKLHEDVHGCEHDRCAPKAARSYRVLWLGTALFALNVVVILLSH